MKALYKALADFQAEVPTIRKNATGYGYKFADLEEINNVIKPLLTKHGLGYIQPLDGTAVKTVIFHVESGESVESTTEIPQGVQLKGQNEFQVAGSAITYFRRYSLSSMLGLVTDEDADASGEQVKTAGNKADSKPKWNPPKDKAVTDQQRIFIANLLRQKGIEGKEAIQEYLADNYGILPEAFMSQADAQMIIDDFKEN